MDKNKKDNTNKDNNSDKSKDDIKTPSAFIGLNNNIKKNNNTIFDNKSIVELLEKNLKWSQIIYEQNRRIGRRLLWTVIATWFKWAVIIIIFVIGTIYAFPFIKDLPYQYNIASSLLSGKSIDSSVLENILDTIPLSEAQQEKIKAMSK